MATVGFHAVEKAYGGRREVKVLHGIDLAVGDGEFVVLVGPSGCGKSTLLRCLAGLEEVTGGRVTIGERDVTALPPRDRDVAMVFQSYALYPHMTVRENMGFALQVRRRPRAEVESAVQGAARMLELEAVLDRLPKQLSGGQRQRVAMGRAIVRRPKVFLFDEPLSNLDASLRTQMRVELKRLHQRLGATILYVTHDQVEALTLADRIAVLDRGLLQQVGTPAELFDTPANLFVAGFIGSPAMNFLRARSDGVEAEVAGLRVPCARAGEVVVGVRPHDVLVGAGPGRARVEVVEHLGWEVHLHLDLAGQRVVARAERAELGLAEPGAEVAVGLGRARLFDAGTGLAL